MKRNRSDPVEIHMLKLSKFWPVCLLLLPAILIATENLFAFSEAFSLISQGSGNVQISFTLPEWEASPVELSGRTFSRISADNAYYTDRKGYPELPFYTTMIEISPGAVPVLRYSTGMRKTLNIPQPALLLNETPDVGANDLDMTSPTGFNRGSGNSNYPPEPVTLSAPFSYNGHTVCNLIVYPFIWNPGKGTLSFAETFQASVGWTEGNPNHSRRTGFSPGLEKLLDNQIINYISTSKINNNTPRAYLSSAPVLSGGNWIRIEVDSSAVYELTYETLAERAGLPGAVDISTLRMFTGSGLMLSTDPDSAIPGLEQVSIEVRDDGDGVFDSGDRIVFFGRSLDRFLVDITGTVKSVRHRYANYNVYWLNWGEQGGETLRIRTEPSTPAAGTQFRKSAEVWYHWEENTMYIAQERPNIGSVKIAAPDYWAWVDDGDNGQQVNRSFALSFPPSTDGQGSSYFRNQLYASLWQADIAYSATLNGTVVDQGTTRFQDVTTSPWQPVSTNTLALTGNRYSLVGNEQILGYFELRVRSQLVLPEKGSLTFHYLYYLSDNDAAPAWEFSSAGTPGTAVYLYDISDPLNPVRMDAQSDGSAVRFQTAGSSILVRSFVALREGEYSQPVNISRKEISTLNRTTSAEYIVIAPEELTAEATRLAEYRQREYSTVMLSTREIYDEYGLGVQDPAAIRNFIEDAVDTWSPQPLMVVLFGDGHNDFRGVTAQGREKPNYIIPYIPVDDGTFDEWFVRVDSLDIPALALGRIPVQSASEAGTVVDKIIAYETGSEASGQWSRRAVIVADDGYVLGRQCDDAIEHTAVSEALDSLLPGDIQSRKVYLHEYPFDPPEIGTRKPAATDDLIKHWNEGALIVNYVGHGSPYHWAQERVFDVERDLQKLTNGVKLPLIVNASCSIGHFDDYLNEAMAERVLTQSGGGAIAAWAATRLSYARQNARLNIALFENLFPASGESVPIGLAALATRLGVAGYEVPNAALYTIFGDPALRLKSAAGKIGFEITSASSVETGSRVDFIGQVMGENGSVLNGYSGVANIKFIGEGSIRTLTYECTRGSSTISPEVSFEKDPVNIFSGQITVNGGRFEGSFVIPVNIGGGLPADSFDMQKGKFIGYSTSADEFAASGAGDQIPIGTKVQATSDTSAPTLRLYVSGRELKDGDGVSSSEPLMLYAADENGINTTGAAGSQLSIEVDDGITYSSNLTEFFEYEQDSYTEGTVAVDISSIESGIHSFRFRASDNMLNSNSLTVLLEVRQSSTNLALRDVLNYPNPFTDETEICFEISAPANVKITIFTVAGRPVKRLDAPGLGSGYHWVRWDGTDEYQQKVANGVYLYKIECNSSNEYFSDGISEAEAIGKAIISR